MFIKHVAEIPYENELVMDTRQVDHGTVSYLEKIGLLGSNLLAAHSVWVNEDEVSIITDPKAIFQHLFFPKWNFSMILMLAIQTSTSA